jgi:hypothetical protein
LKREDRAFGDAFVHLRLALRTRTDQQRGLPWRDPILHLPTSGHAGFLTAKAVEFVRLAATLSGLLPTLEKAPGHTPLDEERTLTVVQNLEALLDPKPDGVLVAV